MLPTSSLTTKLLSFFYLRKRHRVEGNSMSPLLHKGDIVYTKKAQHVNAGDIVVAHHPFRKTYIVKQVRSVNGTMLELSGTNASESEDSRTFGNIPMSSVVGVVVARD